MCDLCAKGQLISKGNFLCPQFSQKNELENVNFCLSLLGQKFFVHFLGELKKPKSPFSIYDNQLLIMGIMYKN